MSHVDHILISSDTDVVIGVIAIMSKRFDIKHTLLGANSLGRWIEWRADWSLVTSSIRELGLIDAQRVDTPAISAMPDETSRQV